MGLIDREWIVFGAAPGYSGHSEERQGLYLIYAHELQRIKIGISCSPIQHRGPTLQTGSPTNLELVFFSKAIGPTGERLLHQRFSRERVLVSGSIGRRRSRAFFRA